MAKNEFDDTKRFFSQNPNGKLTDAAKYVYEETTVFTVNYVVLNACVTMPHEKSLIKRLEQEKLQYNMSR